MKTVRIAAGAGYAGDRIEPALDNIARGNVDYIIFECLAERTIALAQKDKLTDPAGGYNPLLEYRMERVLPLLKEHPVKVITNMGAANPLAAAAKIREMTTALGLGHLKVAAITGDDVLAAIGGYYDAPILETGEALSTLGGRIISANAYIGGRPITEALRAGADIVVTGRVADPSLVTGPLMFEFGADYADCDFLGKTIVAGHLLECAGQATGGYFADPGKKDVPDLWNLPFPILSFDEAGGIVVEKLPGTGGLISEATIKEQLLYEIQDPAGYLTPDVIADFSKLTVAAEGADKVRVENATGKPRSGMLKVSVGYLDGYIGAGEISYGGQNCLARAKLARDVVHKRLEMLNLPFREVRTELLGVNSLYSQAAANLPAPSLNEVRLRMAGRADDAGTAKAMGREVEALYVNGPAGGGGARSTLDKVVSVASILIPEAAIHTKITMGGE